jgi:tRNA/tmRNA/rRNA uracil-C5-methylase (TrmA/RlmC/RlmD family)
VGQRVTVEVERVAHGGHCVARHEGQVLFVRHALPGESVEVEVTSLGRKGRFVRADAVAVLRASPDRRVGPCPVAARCGGCDWQHAIPEASRRLKSAVVREALLRFAGVTLPGGFEVLEVDGAAGPLASAGLGWRTRGTASADGSGRAGFRAHHSHDVVVAGACPQLHPALDAVGLFHTVWPPGSRVGFVAPALGTPLAYPEGSPPSEPVRERAAGREWAVAADGFWQVHPGAADALVGHVRRMLAPRPGERLVDLYAGVGLFGLALADGVPDLAVTLVESDSGACALAEQNRQGVAAAVVHAPVHRYVGEPGGLAGADLVVLDPPRTGAGQRVVGAIAAARPRAIAYVACDPVALARDLATLAGLGYRPAEVVALDLFPTTHHVECVAHLVPA